jgi:hypothetical protein
LGRHGWQFWTTTVTPGISPTAPYATNATHVNELAVWGLNGPPHIFNAYQTQGWAYLTGHADKAIVALPTSPTLTTISRIHGAPSVHVKLVTGTLHVTVILKLTGTLSQFPAGVTLNQQFLRRIQHLGEQAVLARCRAALRLADSTHTDPFGYARTLFWTNNEATHRMSWDQLATLPIHTTLKVKLKVVGQGVSA